MNVIVGAYQTLIDLAIQERGTVKAVFEMAVLNGISITDDLIPGNTIDYDVPTVDIEMLAFYTSKQYKPATALDAAALFNANPSGIDYMIIGTDFIVE